MSGHSLKRLGLVAAIACGSAVAQVPLADWRGELPERGAAGQGASLVVDVDADGRTDVVRPTTAGLEVLLQGVSGDFEVAGRVAWPNSAGRVVAIESVGRQSALRDVVVLRTTSAHYFRNLGRGRFAPVSAVFPRSAGNTAAATGFAIADLDRNGFDDVLIAFNRASPQLFMAQSAGRFVDQTATRLPAQTALQAPWVGAADVDGDGDTDLVQTRLGFATRPILLRNNGRGFFVGVNAFDRTAAPARTFALTDTTGDRRPELIALGQPNTTSSRPQVFVNRNGSFTLDTTKFSVAVDLIVDAASGDFDGDGDIDLATVSADGSVRAVIQEQGVFAKTAKLLTVASRTSVVAADLDGDQDIDLLAGGGQDADRLLRNDGAADWLDVEAATIPEVVLAQSPTLVAVDLHRDGDPDILGYDATGTALTWRNRFGNRFIRETTAMPALGSGAIASFAVGAIAGPSSASAPRRDLLVASQAGTGRPRVLIAQQGGGYRDESATRWPTTISSIARFAVGEFATANGGAGWDDVVTLDARGQLGLQVNRAGRLSNDPLAFGTHSTRTVTDLLVGDLDRDGDDDLVTVEYGGPPQIFLGSATGAFRRFGALPVTTGASRGALVDFDADGRLDLLTVDVRSGQLRAYRGSGTGGFRAVASLALPMTRVGALSSIELVPGATPLILIGDGVSGADVATRWQATGFSVLQRLAKRRHRPTRQFVVADLDLDGDDDLVIGHVGAGPEVLFGLRRHFGQVGACQLGRPVRLRATSNTQRILTFLSGQPGRSELPGFGVLRLQLAGLTPLISRVVVGQQDFVFSTTVQLPEVVVSMQAAFTDPRPLAVTLGSLENVRFDRR